jgi:peptidoglycan/LPS O-acetylase OafA/YrhL
MKAKIEFLDGIRGVAILLVVSAHTHVDDYITPISGGLGVDLFFVLSSFLITFLLYDKLNGCETPGRILKEILLYGFNRVMRIYPMLILTLGLTYYSTYFQESFCRMTPTQVFQPILLRESPCHFWTISVEIQYYLFVPLLCIEVLYLGDKWWVLVSSILCFCIFHDSIAIRGSNTNLANHFCTFLTGSCFGIIYSKIKRDFKALKPNAALFLDITGYVCMFIILGIALQRWFYPFLFISRRSVEYAYISIFLGFVIVKELVQPSQISKFFEANFLTFCGKISFSVYLFHLSAIQYARERESGLSLYYFSFVYAIFQGALIHFSFETIFMKLTRRLGRRFRDKSIPIRGFL